VFNWSLGGKLEVRGWDSLVPRLSPHPIFYCSMFIGARGEPENETRPGKLIKVLEAKEGRSCVIFVLSTK